MNLHKLIGLCYSTDELLQDSPALESWIKSAFPNEFGFKLDEAIVNGNGVGQPMGIMNSGSMISVAAEAGQGAATVVPENIHKMFSRMLPKSVLKAKWYINQEVWPQLFSMVLPVGTAGVPVFMPPGGISSSPYGTLMGRPIMPIEQCQALGTAGDIIFADLSHYYLADKSGIQSDSSIHVQFVTDETAFRFVYRVDGQPKVNSPITPFKGTATLSPFVNLATRP